MEDTSDPYWSVYVRHLPPKSSQLNEKQWRAFLAGLVDMELLSSATSARFNTDYRGPREFTAFQAQLVRWLAPEDEQPRLGDDVIEAIEDNLVLVDRMSASSSSGISSLPSYLSQAMQRIENLFGEANETVKSVQQQLLDQSRCSRLFKVDTTRSSAPTRPVSAWSFQQRSQAFLLREERRHRPLRVERHATDRVSGETMLASFTPTIAQALDIAVCMGTATMEGPESSSAQELVVVLSINRHVASAHAVNGVDIVTAAHREMHLSPYFQQYLGCFDVPTTDDSKDAYGEQLHCFELAPATTLEDLLSSNHKQFHAHPGLIRYLSRELLLAMIDLHEQSTHTIRSPISPQNVFVSHSKRRILLGAIDFGPPIDPWTCGAEAVETYAASREAQLIGDLALLIFAMEYQSSRPRNPAEFHDKYLSRRDVTTFVAQYLVVEETLELRVCNQAQFSLVFALHANSQWILEPSSITLSLLGQTNSPLTTFTFVADRIGRHELVFQSLDRATVPCVTVVIDVSPRSYLLDPPTQLASLLQWCSSPSPGGLRRLLNAHHLFQPLTESEMEQLDSILDQWA